ncbi:MAG: AI-2E family transporter [Clostridia bacterium]|nr:AI-2E family transporter [Clostridia bacterium]
MSHITWKNSVKIILTVLGIYLAIRYTRVALNFISIVIASAVPLVIGCVIAFIVNIVMSFFEGHYFPKTKKKFVKKAKRPLCMLGAYATILLIVVIFISLIFPQIIHSIELIAKRMPGVVDILVSKFEKSNFVSKEMLSLISDIKWESYIDDIVQFVAVGAGSVVETVVKVVSKVFTGVATVFVSVIFSVYLLSSKDKLKNQLSRFMTRYFPPKFTKKISYVSEVSNECFRRYIVAQCTEAVILGALCTVGMYILKIPYPAMIGALIAFTALVPIVGAFVGAGLGAFLILTVSPVKALVFIIFIIILQQLEENLIYPRVVGSSVNLPGIWVLASITVGGGVFGILGMLLAVPVCATVYRIVRDDVNSGLNNITAENTEDKTPEITE